MGETMTDNEIMKNYHEMISENLKLRSTIASLIAGKKITEHEESEEDHRQAIREKIENSLLITIRSMINTQTMNALYDICYRYNADFCDIIHNLTDPDNPLSDFAIDVIVFRSKLDDGEISKFIISQFDLDDSVSKLINMESAIAEEIRFGI
jgi:hypothetical protein